MSKCKATRRLVFVERVLLFWRSGWDEALLVNKQINEITINRHKHRSDLPGLYAFDWHVFQEEGPENQRELFVGR